MPPDPEQEVQKGNPSGPITREQLIQLINRTVQETLPPALTEALEPLKEQQTDHFERLQRAALGSRVVPEAKKGIGAARCVRALAYGRGDPSRAIYFAQKAWDDDLGDNVVKALQAGDFTAGGFMIPPEFLPEIIELLRSRSVVRAAGPRILPMTSGSLTIRRQNTSATATYVGEGANIAASEPTGGQLVMTAKKLSALVPISNDLLMFTSGPTADEFVRDDLVLTIATREDLAFIRDNGLSDTPKGLRFWAAPANVTVSNGTTSDNIEEDLKDLINSLETNDVKLLRPVWFMHPRSKNHLINLRDANGNLIFPEIRTTTPTLYGWPVFVTTNIPVNLGGGTETEVYFVDMMDAIIAESAGLEIVVDSSAAYLEAGSLVSAFTRDETLMRAISRHDFAMRHDVSVAVKNVLTWGA